MLSVSITDLERRLDCVAPRSYVTWLGSRTLEEAVRRGFDPKTVCVLHLEMREAFAGTVWETHLEKFFISDDGSGNYYFVFDEDDFPRVLRLSHDPEGIEDTGRAVAEFLDTERGSLIVRDADEGTAVVARSDVIGESILEPISLSEWKDELEKLPELSYIGVHFGMNPAGEEVRYQMRGLAYGVFHGAEVQARLRCGRIEIWARLEAERDHARYLAERLGRRLRANVTVGTRKRPPRSRRRWFNVKSRGDF